MDSLLAVLAQSSGESFNWNNLFDIPTVIFVFGGVIGGVVAISAIVITSLRGYHETKQLNRLKSDMIDRGFAADEIARVVESGRGTPPKSSGES